MEPAVVSLEDCLKAEAPHVTSCLPRLVKMLADKKSELGMARQLHEKT